MHELGTLAELPRRAADLAILCEIGEVLNSSVKLDEILNMVLTGVTAGQGLRFNRAFLLLLDERARCLRGSHAIGPDNPEDAQRVWRDLEGRQLRLREMLLNHSCESPEVGKRVLEIVESLCVPLDDQSSLLVTGLQQGGARIVIRNEQSDPSTVQIASILGVDRFALVPVLSRSGPVGVLLADNAITGRPIEPADLDMLRLFANHAGTAIEKARLYTKVLEEKNALEAAHDELRRNQQTIINLQRLSDLGEMAARVAHEIRNPLVTIGGFARRLLSTTTSQDPRHRSLEIIVSEVGRLERILIEVLDYARPMRLTPRPTKLNDIVHETVETLAPEAEGLEVELKLDLDESIHEIHADAALVKIALLNILRNALQAIPKENIRRGRVVVRTRNLGSTAQVVVEDNGEGVPPELNELIFEPFFSTKPSGSGLGLAIASQVLKEHGGRIRCESHAERGTAFCLELPMNLNSGRAT